jgi:hypothetical protein
MYCGISVGWKIYCVHFVSQHAYITLILSPVLHLCAVTVFISKGNQTLFKLLLYTDKPDLQISNSQQ